MIVITEEPFEWETDSLMRLYFEKYELRATIDDPWFSKIMRTMSSRKEVMTISIVVTLVSFGVYYYLFACADRRIVFLYDHLGSLPFDKLTTGRYWMAGFVLSGFLSIGFFIWLFIRRLLVRSGIISLKTIAKYAFFPAVVGTTIISMTLGEPTMPFWIAISSSLSLIIGLFLGFDLAGNLITHTRSGLINLIIALGLVPILLLFRSLELPGRGIMSLQTALSYVIFAIVGGFVWLLALLRVFRNHRPGNAALIKSALAIAYVGLPVLHFLLATPPGIPYITSSENFFAEGIMLRIINWLVLVLVVVLTGKLVGNRVKGDGFCIL
ncbi:MAG: hypothetical protein K9I94_05920 [Bacteroidales bacterium]|nr:hypothetical protein [Bacteroidales bacterium]